jgi:hypothetical protein
MIPLSDSGDTVAFAVKVHPEQRKALLPANSAMR